jgi:hypothetical protein
MTTNSAVLAEPAISKTPERPRSAVSDLLQETIRARREVCTHDGLADSSLAGISELLTYSSTARTLMGL